MKIMLEIPDNNGEIEVLADVFRECTQDLAFSVVGAGRLNEQWVDQATVLPEDILREALLDPAAFSMKLSGGVIVTVLDRKTNTAVMVNDPMGAASILKAEVGGRTLISTDMDLIYGRSIEFGEPLEKDPRNIASMLVTGTTGMGWSSYKAVSFIPIFHVVRIEKNSVKFERVDFQSVIHEMQEMSYEKAVEEVRQEIAQNFKALATARRSWKVAHLTGGFDSRLILSFLMNDGVEQEFRFACHGTPVERDREVFEMLVRHFDLPVAQQRYTSVSGAPSSFEEELTAPLSYSWGLSVTGPTNYSVAQDGLILSGGYGEVLRSFYWDRPGKPLFDDKFDLLFTIYGGNIRSFGGDFLSREFLAEQADVLWQHYQEARSLGISDEAAVEYLYFLRNRMFVGLQSHLQRQFITRIDPLYSLKGAALGLIISNEMRRSNIVGIDLMRDNCPELLTIPFDHERVSPELRRKLGIEQETSLINQDSPLKIREVPRLPLLTKPVGYAPRATAEQISWAKEKRASLRQVVWAEPVREKLRIIVQQLSQDGGFSEVFDLQMLTKVLQRPFHNRVLIRSMINFYALFLWYKE